MVLLPANFYTICGVSLNSTVTFLLAKPKLFKYRNGDVSSVTISIVITAMIVTYGHDQHENWETEAEGMLRALRALLMLSGTLPDTPSGPTLSVEVTYY